MADLFNSSVLRIEQPSNQKAEWKISDPDDNHLADVTKVGENPGWLTRFFGTDTGRDVVQVASPDGVPLLFVDRAPYQPMSSGLTQPPCAIVAPNRTLLGHLVQDTRKAAQSFVGGSYQNAYRLLDAGEQLLCNLTSDEIRLRPGLSNPTWVGGLRYFYTDPNDVEIARSETDGSIGGPLSYEYSTTLRIHRRLPEPLCWLIVVPSFAITLMEAGQQY